MFFYETLFTDANYFTESFFLHVIYELVNYAFCVAIAITFFKLKYIAKEDLLAWIILFTTPFFFNYVLFDPALFSDQRGYINFISYIRENGYSGIDLSITGIEKLRTFGLESSVILYSLIPMPMNITITSLAFMNKLLMFFLYVYMLRNTNNKNTILLFFIPSIILYSSLSLRDPLIIFFSSIFIISVIKDKIFIPIICLFLVLLLKTQNAIFLSLVLFGKWFFQADKRGPYLFAGAILLFGIIFQDFVLENLVFFKYAFFLEDNLNYSSIDIRDNFFSAYDSIFHVIYDALISLPGYLLLPYPWSVSSSLQLLQSIENILLIVVLYFMIKTAAIKNFQLTFFLTFCMFVGLALYAFTIYNPGTGARYKIAHVIPFVFGFFYLAMSKPKDKFES
tara:strand:+ start:4368 stop:5549 length:1182 start_codon:yes stop_codon:yes gene_type:complete